MIVYEFYWRDGIGGEHLLGILPERRKRQERITKESVINWGKRIIVDNSSVEDIFFTEKEID